MGTDQELELIGVLTGFFIFLYFIYFGWISKTSIFIWKRAKTEPNYPGYRGVYRYRAFSIMWGFVLFGFIIGLLVSKP